ncbi:MAG: sugar phosphate nucleotidyltransferase [Bacteroidota bacterium]
MKVIIPAAGIGSRLRPHTNTQPKALVPVAGKPILAHIVDELIRIGLKDFIIVVGYLGDKIEQFITEKYPDINVNFIVQQHKQGTGQAIWMARDFVGDDELLIVLGDTIFDVDLSQVLTTDYSSIGIKRVDDPRSFGVVDVDKDGYITKVIEKPKIPKSNMAIVGLYKIKESKLLFEMLEYNINHQIQTHNEFHLTDGIMGMIEKGIKITTFPVENWYDCGNKDTLLETNAVLLKRYSEKAKAAIEMEFENTIIIQPVRIAENCKISNSIIGPNVSIGENAIINRSIIEDSIIGSYSHLENSVLHHSVVGSDALLKGLKQSLNIGDSTEIDFT